VEGVAAEGGAEGAVELDGMNAEVHCDGTQIWAGRKL